MRLKKQRDKPVTHPAHLAEIGRKHNKDQAERLGHKDPTKHTFWNPPHNGTVEPECLKQGIP